MRYVYLNGEYILENEASISINDRGFLFGDGVFSTLKVDEGKIEFFKPHVKRLAASCRELNIEMPVLDKGLIEQLILLNNAQKSLWRLKIILTGGDSNELSLGLRKGSLLITLKPEMAPKNEALKIIFFPQPLYELSSKIKTLAYFDRLRIKQYALDNGFDDALTIDQYGNLLETSFSNVFWINGTEIYFPDPSLPLLQGVTLTELISSLKDHGFVIRPEKNSFNNLPENAYFFTINAIQGILPIVCIEDRIFPLDLSLLHKLQQALKERQLIN